MSGGENKICFREDEIQGGTDIQGRRRTYRCGDGQTGADMDIQGRRRTYRGGNGHTGARQGIDFNSSSKIQEFFQKNLDVKQESRLVENQRCFNQERDKIYNRKSSRLRN